MRSHNLDVARQNAAKHGVSDRIRFLHGKNLEPIQDLRDPFIIISNPPYIPHGTILEKNVSEFEPSTALFVEADGEDVISAITEAAERHPYCRWIALECLASQLLQKNFQSHA